MTDLVAPPPPPPLESIVIAPSLESAALADGADRAAPEGRTWIKLEENVDIPPTGIALGVNGDICMVMAGEPVNLPNRYLDILDHAIINVPIVDNGGRVLGSRPRHRFPYSRVPAPVAA